MFKALNVAIQSTPFVPSLMDPQNFPAHNVTKPTLLLMNPWDIMNIQSHHPWLHCSSSYLYFRKTVVLTISIQYVNTSLVAESLFPVPRVSLEIPERVISTLAVFSQGLYSPCMDCFTCGLVTGVSKESSSYGGVTQGHVIPL